MTAEDRRLIEDYLPIQAISAEASREKSVRKGHISTLHLWWARRPLVACRAAVYGALVPASRFRPANGPEERRESLGRANATRFIERLCKYPGEPQVIEEARHHILEAHAERLSQETGKKVTVEDILQGRAPRPKTLDMFAGGGAIPLEMLRLDCEAYALELNPVAHIIELCTLVYPQKFGRPDRSAKGSAKDGTWAGLAEEVRCWGSWVLEKVKAEIGDLYPAIPDPDSKQSHLGPGRNSGLVPVAYLWTRTVRCKKPTCGATVPLVRQTWLCKKKDRCVALKMVAPEGKKKVRFEVVEGPTESSLGFDPAGFSKGGNATCPFCGTVADSDYVKAEGRAGRMGRQMMAVVCTRSRAKGKVYLSADDYPECAPDDAAIRRRIEALCRRTGLSVPNELMDTESQTTVAGRGFGINTWAQLFTPRQLLCLLTFAAAVREAEGEMRKAGMDVERVKGVVTYLATAGDREAEDSSSLCRWNPNAEKMQGTFGRQALPMVWDFCEINPFGDSVGDWSSLVDLQVNAIEGAAQFGGCIGEVTRGSATALPWPDAAFDAVVTDPPYYDNVDYARLSDFFYVWLKRTIGHLYPEHFATEGTPKKQEAVADAVRHGGDKEKARRAYEQMMAQAFAEANRVLKPGGPMVVVYAHKTTLGWSTLVDALRQAGFMVTEAWPLDTEMKSRLVAMETASLASSIFLVARKRKETRRGSYENDVLPELERIVRERVETLWEAKTSIADLLIAAVGAGLRAYTRFPSVEYENGEPVPVAVYLEEVERLVLETLREKIEKEKAPGLHGLDPTSQFYTLWSLAYQNAPVDAGEAIVFTYPFQGVELDGPRGLSSGSRPLLEKRSGKYRLLDFEERGENDSLGLPRDDGQPAPLVDVVHRSLWLLEHRPAALSVFLEEARPDLERLRLLASILSRPALEGGDGGPATREQKTAEKLTAHWRTLVDERALGQQKLTFFQGKEAKGGAP